MRILHVVTNSDLGGAPRVVTELSARAVSSGHTCAVAAAPGGPMWQSLDHRVEQFPIRSMRRGVNPIQDTRTLLFLRRLFHQFGPDIIHLHSSKAGALGRFAALTKGSQYATRCVYTIHGFDTILKAHPYYLPLERALAQVTGAIVPVSRYDAHNLQQVGIAKNSEILDSSILDIQKDTQSGIDRSGHPRIVFIPNGVTDRKGSQSTDARACTALLAARRQSRPIVLTIARLERPKRADLFLDVARCMPDVAFFWVGNVQSPRAVFPAETLIPPNLSFLGESPDAGTLANLCDIFMLLSDYEGAPMSILEAMSCGKPIIASDVGGVPEIIDNGQSAAGICVPNEFSAIVRAVSLLLEKPELAAQFAAHARARYEAVYSADRMWQSYFSLYIKLLAL
ncbi:MAG TPA: glycosyltransferase [Rectinema sp.]|nr:glycosyltransferase [Spirochaetota bacterium]HNT59906.1 glycosyltransferase [Rectinema sp.]HPG95746.1 glycosyltransferase [Rectinema sp.]HPN02795.1 glycosyltransferase [Rectinema sp.]